MSDSLAHEASDAGEDQMETMGEVEVPVVAKRGRGNPRLAEARELAHEARRKQGAITKAKKLQAKQERDAEYAKALEFLNGPEKPAKKEEVLEEKPKAKKEKGAPRKTRVKTIEISDSSSSSESEESSDSDGSIDVVRVVRKKKPPPPPKKKKSKIRVESESDEEDEEVDDTRLAGQVAREMLRKRVLERAATDAIRRLVPNYKGGLY
jgi:hypothetical protein